MINCSHQELAAATAPGKYFFSQFGVWEEWGGPAFAERTPKRTRHPLGERRNGVKSWSLNQAWIGAFSWEARLCFPWAGKEAVSRVGSANKGRPSSVGWCGGGVISHQRQV